MDNRGYERCPGGVHDDEEHTTHYLIRSGINFLSLVFSMLVLGLIICYPVALTRGTATSMESVLKILPAECSPTINELDKTLFLNDIIDGNSRLLYVNLTVNMNHTCTNCPAFMPRYWVWVYADSSEVSMFLNWQEDYAIWSFGILDFYATRNVQISLNFSSSCEEKFGEASVMMAIAETLNNMTGTGLSYMKQDYNDSMWCYRTKLNRLTDTEKQFVRNFRYFVQDMGTVCFKLRNNKRITKPPDRFWTNIPFGITYIALLFSPLLYAYLLHFLLNKSPIPWLGWGGDPSDKVLQNDSYIYQGFKSPVTFSSILTEVLPARFRNSVIVELITTFLILIVSPTVIYVKVLIYHINGDFNDLLERQIKHGISIGFSSMLFSFEQKSENFLTFIAGPCILLLVYYCLGSGLIIINHLLGSDLKCEEDDIKSEIPLASLHLDTFKCMKNNTLKNKILNAVAENSVKHSLSVNFLDHILKTDRIWQMPFSILFHQIPFLFMSHLILKNNIKCISEKLHKFGALGIVLCFIFGIISVVFLFAFVTIFFASFEFLALIVTFCYIAMVTYPTESAGYFLFGMAALYYLTHCLREIAQKYQHLLILSVEASRELENRALLKNNLVHEYLRHAHGSWGIPKRLFKEIIDKYEPKATTIKKALVKIIFVICVLAWTLQLVFKLHESQNLDPLVRLFSAVLIVSLPNLIWLLAHDFSKETLNSICKIHLQTFIENFWIQEQLENQNRHLDYIS